MLDFGWTDNFLYFLGIIPAIFFLFFVTSISKLLGISIQQPKIQLKKAEDLPQFLKKLYADAVTQLTPLGFKIQHCQVSKDLIAIDNSVKWSLVLSHPETNVLAEISPATTFLDMPGYEVNFWSFAPDGNALLTVNGRGYTILAEIPGVTIHDPHVLSLHQQYDTHLEERREWSSSTNYQAPNPLDYGKLQQRLLKGYFDNLKEEGSLKPQGESQFRLSFIKCLKLLPGYIKGIRNAKKLLNTRFKSKLKNKLTGTASKAQSSFEYPVETDLMANIKMRSAYKRDASGLFAKIMLVIAALLVTYIGLGVDIKAHSFLILLSVFLVHELGHLLAMIFFSYRDPQVICVPLLGLSANKPRQAIANWKQVIVHLMGPLPGIVAGIALLLINKQFPVDWIYETAVVMLVVNYLHLLPYMSLDGGRIMRLTVMDRFPMGKIMFPLVSSAIFSAGGYFFVEPVFWALAMLTAASIPFGMREIAILRLVRKQVKELKNKNGKITDLYSLDETNRMARAFNALKHKKFRKLDFVKKYSLVRALDGLFLQPKHSNGYTSFGFVCVYLCILTLTPAAFLLTDLSTFESRQVSLVHLGKTAKNDEESKIRRAKTHKERFNLLVKFADRELDNNNLQKAFDYLERAESTYGNINRDLELAILFEKYSRYYSLADGLDDSFQYMDKAISLRKKAKNPDNYQLAKNYVGLSSISLRQQKNGQSEQYLQKALFHSLKIDDVKQCHIITKVSGQLLDWYYTEDRNEEASQLLQNLIKKFETRDSPIKNYITKFVFEEHGWLYAANNNEKAALEKFDEALELAEKTSEKLGSDKPDRREEAKLLLYKAAVYFKEGYKDFSRIQFDNAELIAKENSYRSIEQYINEYSKAAAPVNTNKNNIHRESKRWKLISDAYTQINS